MTPPLITDAEDWTAALKDGFMHLHFGLEPGGRIEITGWERTEKGSDLVYRTTHSPKAIDELADALKAMAAHARGENDH